MTAEAQQYLSPGSQVGAYTLDSDPEAYLLGVGSFGIVYRCRQTTSGADCVLKEYFPFGHVTRDSSTDAVLPFSGSGPIFSEGLAEFEQEASRLAEFSGERTIVDCVEFVGVNGTGYLVMPWAPGETLQDRVGRDGPIPPNQLQKIMLDLLAALKAIHEAGYVHRDIKPSNIWLPQQGGAMVLDFGGLSEVYQQEKGSRSGLFSEGYSPWEQYARLSEKVGPWSDIYSLGASMYFAIAGSPPLDCIHRLYALRFIKDDPLERAQCQFSEKYGIRLTEVIDQMLHVDPLFRIKTAAHAQLGMSFGSFDRLSDIGKSYSILSDGLERPEEMEPFSRDTLWDHDSPIEMVVVPAGRCFIGDVSNADDLEERQGGNGFLNFSNSERVQLCEVIIERPFAMSRHPVSRRQFKRFVCDVLQKNVLPESEAERLDEKYMTRCGDYAVRVTWWIAQLFVGWLTAETGKVYRIPSEAEWEYAAKSGGGTMLPDRKYGRFDFHGRKKMGLHPPNLFNLCELGCLGPEWCADHWHDNDSFQGTTSDGKPWLATGDWTARVQKEMCGAGISRKSGRVEIEWVWRQQRRREEILKRGVFRGHEGLIRLARDI